jgi:hypothetical protein
MITTGELNMRKNLLRLLAVLSALGLIFNIFQIIIILAGSYNRNPAISPEWLQALDSIALTLFYAVISLLVLIGSVVQLRQMK